jgi:hypothetical protein
MYPKQNHNFCEIWNEGKLILLLVMEVIYLVAWIPADIAPLGQEIVK